MKKNDFVKLEKKLMPHLAPGLATKGSLCFFAPINDTLRGFQFEPSAFNQKDFYVTIFFLPLFVPLKSLHVTFGHRIGGGKRWNSGQVDLEPALAREMREELPFLTGLNTPEDVARTLEPMTELPNPNCLEAFSYALIKSGQIGPAAKALTSLLNSLEVAVPWQNEIASRVALIQDQVSISLQEAKHQLSMWELESVANLGLGSFYFPAGGSPLTCP
jgi:hypothetical protein